MPVASLITSKFRGGGTGLRPLSLNVCELMSNVDFETELVNLACTVIN